MELQNKMIAVFGDTGQFEDLGYGNYHSSYLFWEAAIRERR